MHPITEGKSRVLLSSLFEPYSDRIEKAKRKNRRMVQVRSGNVAIIQRFQPIRTI